MPKKDPQRKCAVTNQVADRDGRTCLQVCHSE